MLNSKIRILMMLCFASAACAAGRAVAQIAPQISVPVLDFVVDGGDRLRPLVGVAGAASVGPSMDLGFNVKQAAVPPGHDYILATAENGSPQLLQVRGNTVTARSLDASISGTVSQTADQADCDGRDDVSFSRLRRSSPCIAGTPRASIPMTIDRIALSPTGSAAALYSAAQGRIYAFTNLAQAEMSGEPLGHFSIGQAGAVSAFGISDDGKTVVVGISDGDTGGLFVAALNQSARLVSAMRHPSAVAFLRGSNNAIVADDVENKVYAVSGGQVFAIASADDGISKPVGIAVSNDNQRMFVGNAGTGSVSTIATAGGAPAAPVACKCSLTGLFPTNTDSVFRLTDFSGGTVLLFDASGATSRIVFVPMGSSPF